jgi:glutamate N-acetyltransferase/amino-acid N-acetyltransferase
MEKIASGIQRAVSSLSKEGGKDAAEAIMTTDTFPKHTAVQFEIGDSPVLMAGMAKGAGMIRPNMATMLAFLVTDAAVEKSFLQEALQNTVKKTFNRITVDGDTSTNDMVILLANGLSHTPNISSRSQGKDVFVEALEYVCERLSFMIVSDGEGATKLVGIHVIGTKSDSDASRIAFRIAESLLVKTSLYGRSCNWGRVMAAAGSAGVPIEPEKIDIFYGSVQVVHLGLGLGSDTEKEAESYLRSQEVDITIDLHMGTGNATVRTTDLSPEYVHINAEYKT